MEIVEIYTDGACKGNPGPGGWGALLKWKDREKEIWGGENPTTNNRMELRAVIEAISVLEKPVRARIYTDSKYVANGITSWIANWKQKNWMNSSKKPVKNVDLWKKLDSLTDGNDLEWFWVKGHAGNKGNERADELANLGIVVDSNSNSPAREKLVGSTCAK